MRHIALLFAILPAIIASATPICTNGFSLINNKCLRLFTSPMVHKDAVATCSSYAGTLVTIKNAIDNRAITTFVGSSIKHTWIGLFCFQSDPTNCYWDDESGTSADYSSFAKSFPYTDVGNCVYYSVSGTLAGQWVSGDCDDDLRPFVCEMPSTFYGRT
ncbi:hypothetical protein GCK72_004429 [Caenorhabditis remanei]|uniref:C-type lectin domain-containing protein n=1 Tax=Caenorhabditis remanei TaxID=31234 RepID=A0A6A5HC48_CAERE|nr:hypothetical protein GCK72_004429 [Caenorhabditis remanei]KAF1764481.1 hypothetical protein GCK72_004429 [Caenorhabditis remanei]